jgi:hypothetical protein
MVSLHSPSMNTRTPMGSGGAHSIQLLALQDEIISTLTLLTPPAGPPLLPAFGLLLVIPGDGSNELLSAPHHS